MCCSRICKPHNHHMYLNNDRERVLVNGDFGGGVKNRIIKYRIDPGTQMGTNIPLSKWWQ